MTITFLGTGTSHGVPMIGCECATCTSTDPHDTRLRPSIHLALPDGTSILVDAGPDLRQQALRMRLRQVDVILFTHGHADHILGLDETRRFTGVSGQAMPCYADAATIADIRRMFAYVFDPGTPRGGGLPELELREVSGPIAIGAHQVIPVPLMHGKRPILGYRFGGLAYLTDCSAIPDESWPLLRDLDVVVLDALRHRPHPTHFSLSEAVVAARRIGARQTYFTHMCHDLAHEETCASLPDGITLAYDGLTLTFENPRTDGPRDPGTH